MCDCEWKRKKKEWERGKCKLIVVVFCGMKLFFEEGSGEKLGLGMVDIGCECVYFFWLSYFLVVGERRVGIG